MVKEKKEKEELSVGPALLAAPDGVVVFAAALPLQHMASICVAPSPRRPIGPRVVHVRRATRQPRAAACRGRRRWKNTGRVATILLNIYIYNLFVSC